MYRRVVVNFCNSIEIERFYTTIINNNDIAIRTSYSYLSVADIALSNCYLVANQRKSLGSIAIGKVVDKGVNVSGIYEGVRVVVFPINSPQYLETSGGAQDIVVVDQSYAKVVELKSYSDLEVLIIAALSVEGELIEYIKGKDVLLIGNDISLAAFAYYASKYSCRVGIIPKQFPDLGLAKAEHISLYDKSRQFDVVVVATANPVYVRLATRNMLKNRDSMVILYPHTHNLLHGICTKYNVRIRSMAFGDIDIGLKVFESYRDTIMSKIKAFDMNQLPKNITEPLFIKFS